MTYARTLAVKIKPVGREEVIDIIDDFGKQLAEDFEGMLTLLPMDDPNKATLVTL